MTFFIFSAIIAGTVLAVATGVNQKDDRLCQEADALKGLTGDRF